MPDGTLRKKEPVMNNTLPQDDEYENGSARDWEAWLKEHAARIYLFARQQARTQEDAEDIVQEALVRLARKEASGEFIGGREAWLPFVYTSIRRIAIDFRRRDDRRTRREQTSADDTTDLLNDPWFSSESGEDELRNLLDRQLKKLPGKFSEVIILKIWGEQTFQQIADTLGISLNTVASRYRYGLEQLRKAISGQKDDYQY